MIEGVVIKRLDSHFDERGWLSELYRNDEIEVGIKPAMAYLSSTNYLRVRGPHEHVFQTDHFFFLGTSIMWLYLWDNRPDSPTFGKSHREVCSIGEVVEVIIPPGVVHAYKNMDSLDGLVLNLPNELYKGYGKTETVDEIRHEGLSNSPFKLE